MKTCGPYHGARRGQTDCNWRAPRDVVSTRDDVITWRIKSFCLEFARDSPKSQDVSSGACHVIGQKCRLCRRRPQLDRRNRVTGIERRKLDPARPIRWPRPEWSGFSESPMAAARARSVSECAQFVAATMGLCRERTEPLSNGQHWVVKAFVRRNALKKNRRSDGPNGG